MAMLIHNANIITWGEPNQILRDHAVVLQDGLIQEIGPSQELSAQHPERERWDAAGQYLMPGGICAHTHFYGAFARGMAIPGRPPRDFPEILRKLWWPLDKSLGAEDVRYSALVSLVDAIRHGTTTLIDHHASPNCIEGSLDLLAAAVEQAGLRAVLCYEVTDRDGADRAQAGIQENRRFLQRCADGGLAGGRVAGTFGLHASLTLSDETLEACRQEAPQGVGFHIHLAEHEADEQDSLDKSGLRAAARLDRHGILGDRTIVAHAVHVDVEEIATLREKDTWVSHQPRSNMNNAVGAAEVDAMLEAGLKVCLGNDGFSNAMWQEWKAAYLLHKVWHRDPRRMGGEAVVRMAAYHNAALAQVFFPGAPLGVVAPGARADLILVDYHPFTPLSAGNLPWHMLFGFRDSMVTATLVAGQTLMRDRRLLTLDEAEISARAGELAPAVWRRYHSQVPED